MSRLAAFLIALPLFAGPASAWSTKDHRAIVALAIEHGAPELAAFLRVHVADAMRGAVDPDLRFMDTENHTYEVADGTRNNPRHVESLCATLASMIRDGAPREQVAYWLGALSHYVSDIDQPLHASDRDKHEIWYHPLFEALDYGVDARGHLMGVDVRLTIGKALADWTFVRGSTRAPIDDVAAWQTANARWSHRYYEEIGRLYTDGKDDDGRLAEIYRTCLAEAVDDVIDAWAHVVRTASVDKLDLPAQADVLILDVDDDGRIRRGGERLSARRLAAVVRLHRSRAGAIPSAFLEIDERCAAGLEERVAADCRAAGLERVATVRVPMGSAAGRFLRAASIHAASLLRK